MTFSFTLLRREASRPPLIALEVRTCEQKESDDEILQRVRHDDRAQIALEVAHDEAIYQCQRGQRKNRAKTFVKMHGAEEQRTEEDRSDGSLRPRSELLQQVA